MARPPTAEWALKESVALHPNTTLARVRRQVSTIVGMLSQRPILSASPGFLVQRVAEAAAAAVNVGRVTVWQLAGASDRMSCNYVLDARRSGGPYVTMSASEAGAYFEALLLDPVIAVNDVTRDMRTRCRAAYYKNAGVGAILDVPFWVKGRFAGVLSHEHLGGARVWDGDDQRGAQLVTGFLSFCLESR
jgi:GAF domain-containing protein